MAASPAVAASRVQLPLPPRVLYVHVPFCVSLCPYCDFVVYTGATTRGPRSRISAFVAALLVELELRADVFDAAFGSPGSAGRPALVSVYLGGGTPSLLAVGDMAAVLDRVERRFGLADDAEITLEANPGPDERGDLAGFRAAGVTRLSVGAQSLDAAELRRIGRRHRPADVGATLDAARRAGIGHRSIDLLYDLPGQDPATWARSLERAVELPIDHLSAYALTLDDPDAEGLTGATGDHLPVRPGARRWRRAAAAAQDEDRAADAYTEADRRLAGAGFEWYELSNWARPGAESRHNLAYWLRSSHAALGPGAHAFDGALRRTWTAARLDAYLSALSPVDAAAARLPPGGSDLLDEAGADRERAILGLRLRRGISAELASLPGIVEVMAWAADAGLAERVEDDRWRLSPRGRLLAGEVFARLV